MKRKIISAILSLAICLCLSACGTNGDKIAPTVYEETQKNKSGNFVAVENNRYSLSWDNDERRIVFFDKEKNIPWCYTPNQAMEKKYDSEGLEIINHPQISSPINITVFNKIKNVDDVILGYNGSVKKNTFSVNKIKNGISITYYFDKEKISITVDYTLRDDSLLVSIDPQKITEGEEFMLASVSIAPFFCSIPNVTDDTYLFVPSGSGALVYADYETEDAVNITEEVYGLDARRPSDDMLKGNTSKVAIPVYGAKNGNNGITAIIEEGSGAANISVNAGNKNTGYSSVYSVFQVRNYETMPTNTGVGQRTIYAEELTTNPISIGFYPIYDAEANYIGMANVYKKYLEKQGVKPSKTNETLLSLEILGGTNVTESFLGVPYDTLFATSTVDDARVMIENIVEETGIKPAVQLCGYGSSGLEIGKIGGNFVLNNKLGSKEDLIELNKYCSSNNIPLYFDYDVVQFKKSSSKASTMYDAALTTNGRTISLKYYHLWSGTRDTTGKGWNNSSYFTLIKRSLLPKMLDFVLESAEKYNLNGISLSTMGKIAYSDNSEQCYYSKGLIDEQVNNAIRKLKDSGKGVMLNNANAYAAIESDYILDVPIKSSKYEIYDVDIPFYQFVFKGLVPISTSPITASADVNENVLKAVESGTGLTFALSYNYDRKIINNSDIRYFGSNYKQVKNTIIELTTKNKDYYNSIHSAKIVEHKILSDTLRHTVYDNGVEVYVNYSDTEVETPLGIVSPNDYVYSNGGVS